MHDRRIRTQKRLPAGTWEFACPDGTPLPPNAPKLPYSAEKARQRELTRFAEDAA